MGMLFRGLKATATIKASLREARRTENVAAPDGAETKSPDAGYKDAAPNGLRPTAGASSAIPAPPRQ